VNENRKHSVKDRAQIRRALVLGILLVAAWLLWSGLFKPLLLGLGLFSCIITIYLLQRMGYFSNETFAFRYSPKLLNFWGWLGKEIFVSGLEVTRVVLSRKINVEPVILTLDVDDLEAVDQALLGNSITLTPGTLTLDVYDDQILVHALTAKGAADLSAGGMQRRVAELRGN
jgi:multicomponent Na+:H+ antiporter subunit E